MAVRPVLLLGFLFVASTASAHDFWIEADSFVAAKDKVVAMTLFVGPNFVGEPYARSPAHIVSFTIKGLGPNGQTVPVPGRSGRNPAGQYRFPADGPYVAAYVSRASDVELTVEKFKEYLAEEGLSESVPAATVSTLEAAKAKVVDHFSRAAKALFRPQSDAGPLDTPLGLPVELVAEGTSLRLAGGKVVLPFRLLLDGKPLTAHVVFLLRKGDAKFQQRQRTDSAGRATFTASDPGTYLAKSVYLVPRRSDGTEWDSLWASSTFQIE